MWLSLSLHVFGNDCSHSSGKLLVTVA